MSRGFINQSKVISSLRWGHISQFLSQEFSLADLHTATSPFLQFNGLPFHNSPSPTQNMERRICTHRIHNHTIHIWVLLTKSSNGLTWSAASTDQDEFCLFQLSPPEFFHCGERALESATFTLYFPSPQTASISAVSSKSCRTPSPFSKQTSSASRAHTPKLVGLFTSSLFQSK